MITKIVKVLVIVGIIMTGITLAAPSTHSAADIQAYELFWIVLLLSMLVAIQWVRYIDSK